MANTKTRLDPIHKKYYDIIPYAVSLGTVDTDFEIHTPVSGKRVFVVGLMLSETDASNLTIKTGSTTYNVLELAANQGIYDKIEPESFIMCTDFGEALNLSASVAISNLTIHIVEARALREP